jgi:hypothetical protein
MDKANHHCELKSRTLNAICFTLAALLCITAEAQVLKRALFLGNSYTNYNNLPQLTASIAESAGDTLITSANTPGGYTFEGHLTNATSLSLIEQGNWDFVILQQQSQMPAFPIMQVELETFPFAAQLNESIIANNPCAETVFYMTWGRQNGDQQNCATWPPVCTYEGMDDLLRERYMMMAEMNEGIVSPVGAVWRYLRENHPTIQLFASDGSHPSAAGSYVAAVCFYTSLFRKSPLNALYDYTIDNAQESIIRQAVHDVVYMNQSEWDIGIWDPIAQLSLVQQNDTPYAFVQSSTRADDIYYAIDNAQLQPWIADSIFVGTLQPGSHTIELIAGRCGMWDTTSIAFNIAVNAINNATAEILSTYPNPASDQLTIDLTEKWNDVVLEIYDLRGVLIASTRNKGNRKVVLECAHWAEGTYTFVISEGNKKAIGTFMLVK